MLRTFTSYVRINNHGGINILYIVVSRICLHVNNKIQYRYNKNSVCLFEYKNGTKVNNVDTSYNTFSLVIKHFIKPNNLKDLKIIKS